MAIRYGTHASANKEAEFIHAELAEEVQAGHVAVFPLEVFTDLQNLCLSPITTIPQVGRRPRLIFDFTWIRINEIAERLAPMEVMRFGGALQRILKQVLIVDPRLGPVYLSKVDLADAYMRLWVRVEDVPSLAFLISNKTPINTQLVGFHASLPMRYINSALYFFMAAETVANLANESISQREQAVGHPLKMVDKARAAKCAGAPEDQADAIWKHISADQLAATKSNAGVYLDNFISVVQGVPREKRQILRHLFQKIDRVFRPNEDSDTNCKEPIFLKKLGKGDGEWSTWKTVIGWYLYTIARLLCLPPRR